MRRGGVGPSAGRRSVVRGTLTGLGGFAAATLLPSLQGRAYAAPADPGAGAVVTPDPIKPRITKSGLTVEIVDFSTPPRTASSRPYARLNTLFPAYDGSGRLFANDTLGKIWLINPTTGAAHLFLDLAAVRGSKFIPRGPKITKGMGLRSFAFHPDFARTGRPGQRKLYTVSTESASGGGAGVRPRRPTAPGSISRCDRRVERRPEEPLARQPGVAA